VHPQELVIELLLQVLEGIGKQQRTGGAVGRDILLFRQEAMDIGQCHGFHTPVRLAAYLTAHLVGLAPCLAVVLHTGQLQPVDPAGIGQGPCQLDFPHRLEQVSHCLVLHYFGLHGMRFTMIQTYIKNRNHIGGIVSLSEYFECPLLAQSKHLILAAGIELISVNTLLIMILGMK